MGVLKKVVKYGAKAAVCVACPAAAPYIIAGEMVSQGVRRAVQDGEDDKFARNLGKTAGVMFGDSSAVFDNE